MTCNESAMPERKGLDHMDPVKSNDQTSAKPKE